MSISSDRRVTAEAGIQLGLGALASCAGVALLKDRGSTVISGMFLSPGIGAVRDVVLEDWETLSYGQFFKNFLGRSMDSITPSLCHFAFNTLSSGVEQKGINRLFVEVVKGGAVSGIADVVSHVSEDPREAITYLRYKGWQDFLVSYAAGGAGIASSLVVENLVLSGLKRVFEPAEGGFRTSIVIALLAGAAGGAAGGVARKTAEICFRDAGKKGLEMGWKEMAIRQAVEGWILGANLGAVKILKAYYDKVSHAYGSISEEGPQEGFKYPDVLDREEAAIAEEKQLVLSQIAASEGKQLGDLWARGFRPGGFPISSQGDAVRLLAQGVAVRFSKPGSEPRYLMNSSESAQRYAVLEARSAGLQAHRNEMRLLESAGRLWIDNQLAKQGLKQL